MRKLLFFKFPKSIQIYNLITIQSDSNLCYHGRPWISPNVEGLAHLLVRERKGAARVVAIVRQRIQEKKKTKKHPNSNLQKATTRVALDLRHPSLVPRNVGNRTGAIESRPLFRLYFPGTMRYRFFLLLLLFLVLLLLLHAGQRDKETKRVTGRSDVSANILDRRR